METFEVEGLGFCVFDYRHGQLFKGSLKTKPMNIREQPAYIIEAVKRAWLAKAEFVNPLSPVARVCVPATRVMCTNNFGIPTLAVVALHKADGEWRSSDYTIKIEEGGVTGYESFYLCSEMVAKFEEPDYKLWWCAGTTMQWDGLYTDGEAHREIMERFKLKELVLNEK